MRAVDIVKKTTITSADWAEAFRKTEKRIRNLLGNQKRGHWSQRKQRILGTLQERLRSWRSA